MVATNILETTNSKVKFHPQAQSKHGITKEFSIQYIIHE